MFLVVDVAIGGFGGRSGGVLRERNTARFNVFDIFDEKVEMSLDFVGGLATADGVGDIEPAIRGVLVKDSQGPFKGFVLVGSPRGRVMRGWGDGTGSHCWGAKMVKNRWGRKSLEREGIL